MEKLSKLSKDFLWGGAIAANQAEGAYDADGKGLSLMDIATSASKDVSRQFTDGIKKGIYYPNHEGIDFYHKYKEDLALFEEMGSNVLGPQSLGAVFSLMVMKSFLMN